MKELFVPKRPVSQTANNILKQRYFGEGESKWEDVVNRVIDNIIPEASETRKESTREMMLNTYFIPNSPCLVNAGKPNAGLAACFVVDFPDNIEGIYKTKLDFALIARKGGGCGTSLSRIRPEGAKVAGSRHGYAGGGVKFADTISHDADALTQAGFRQMAIMFTESVYHPDILKFIKKYHTFRSLTCTIRGAIPGEQGDDVMPWCPRCATGISQHEIATEGYQELTHRAVTLRFPLLGRDKESLLVWTTTPWTLTSNVAVAVGPDLTYAKVRQEDEVFYLSEETLSMLNGPYEILGELKGAEMEGWAYSGPFDDLNPAQTPGGYT